MISLISGMSGFVGSHLAGYLFTQGDSVIELDPSVDISDSLQLAAAFEKLAGKGIDSIYHLAALAHVQQSFSSSADVFRVNVIGTLNLLEAARRTFPNAKVLMVSSSEVYGPVSAENLPVTELLPVAPLSPYAVSKVAAEQVALQAVRAYGQQVVIARPFNHIGPGQSASYVVSALAKRVLEAKRDKKKSIVVGNLSSRRDFTDVRDVVKAYRKMIEFSDAGEIFNICSGRSISILELSELIIRLAETEVFLENDPSLTRVIEVSDVFGSYAKCRDSLSWEPLISIETSLKDVLLWWSTRL